MKRGQRAQWEQVMHRIRATGFVSESRVRRVAGLARSTQRSAGRLAGGLAHTADRLAVTSRLPKGGVGAEVGVWRGDNAAMLLSQTKPAELYLIDPWQPFQADGLERSVFSRATQQEMDEIHEGVKARFRKPIADGTVKILRETSEVAGARLPQGSLDWAYIDGDHRADGVRRDLHLYSRVVRPGGFLAGDDYGIVGWWENGVQVAVDEFAAGERCAEIASWGSQFLIRLAG